MSDFDNLIVGFKDNMAKTALFINGNDQTDVLTAMGPVPSLSKLVRQSTAALATLLPSLENRLRLDGDGAYSVEQKAWGRKNLDIDLVNNTADADKPLSTLQKQALDLISNDLRTRENVNQRNVVASGYFAYDGARLPIRNGADSLFGYLFHNATVSRSWQLPDKDGEIALKSDIVGNNSNTNTGDETTETILAKLNLTAISGLNTGDETKAGILQKLGAAVVTGNNTGDETRASIVAKIGYDVMSLAARNAVNGVAPLDANKLIPVENLPPAFESVAPVVNANALPAVGVIKRLYIALDNSGLYYWGGSAYQQLNTALKDTDQLTEGAQNLYFTQLRAVEAVLTTYSAGQIGDVDNRDKVVNAISKLQRQIKTEITNTDAKLAAAKVVADNALALKENLANKAVDFSTANDTLYPSVLAVTKYIDARLSSSLNERGNWSAAAGTFPASGGSKSDGTIKKGDMWYVSVGGTLPYMNNGTLTTIAVNVGDSFRALIDAPGQDPRNWGVLESNIGYVPENTAAKGAAGGYPGMDASRRIYVYLAGGAVGATLGSVATVQRAINLPDKDGTVALLSDVTGSNSGSNTGDETKATILSKLGATAVTGSNSGDETAATIRTKLGIVTLSGVNTGDETKAGMLSKLGAIVLTGSNTGDETQSSIINKIGYEVMPQTARDQAGGVAPLDDNGKVPAANLPPDFESVAPVANLAALPAQGVVKRLYITLDANGLYFWTGSVYQQLNLQLANTDALAEGALNLYFTQVRAVESVLSTYVANRTGDVAKTDKVVNAISKLQYQIKQVITSTDTKLANARVLVDASLALKEDLANKATNFSVLNDILYPSVLAVANYMDQRFTSVLNERGNWDASQGGFPTAGGSKSDGSIKKGDMWYVSVAGTLPRWVGGRIPTLGTIDVNVGDSFRALVDSPAQDPNNWGVLESNLGYVPENVANRNMPLGYVGLDVLNRLTVTSQAPGGAVSYLGSQATAERSIQLPDKSGTVALLSDIGGTNTGVNTGDETGQTITDKLAGRLQLTSKWPAIHFREDDQASPYGAYRIVCDGGMFRIDVDHSANGNFLDTVNWINALSIGYTGATRLQGLSVIPEFLATGTGEPLNLVAQSSSNDAGGNVAIYAGNSGATAAAHKAGGWVSITAGAGAWANGSAGTPVNASGGRVEITGGAGAANANNAAAAGGGVVLRGGPGGASGVGNGGHALVQGGSSAGGQGGDAYLWAGNGLNKGGYAGITSGYGTGANGSGGTVEIVAREGKGTGSGGDLLLTSGNAVSGTKGKVIVTAPGGMTVNGLPLTGTNTGDETRQSILDKLNAILHLTGTTPSIIFNDQSLVGGDTSRGAFRIIDRNDVLAFEVNTSADRNFGDYKTPLQITRNQIYVKYWLQLEGQFGIGNYPITMAGTTRWTRYTTNLDVQRWLIGVRDDSDPAVSVASNYVMQRCDAGGGYLDTPFEIDYRTGDVKIQDAMIGRIKAPRLLTNYTLQTASTNASTGVVTMTADHGLVAGAFLWYSTSGVSLAVGQEISKGRGFFISPVGARGIKLYDTYEDSLAGVNALIISRVGTGVEIWRPAVQAIEYIMDGASTNTTKLAIQTYRWTGGDTWLSSSTRLQMKIDHTNQGYLEFNPPNNASGTLLASATDSGYLQFGVMGAVQAAVSGPKNAVNMVLLQGAVAGQGVKIDAFGDSANINVHLTAKGNGELVQESPVTLNRGLLQASPGFVSGNGSGANSVFTPNVRGTSVIRLTVNGTASIVCTDWPAAGYYGRIVIEIVNGGSYPLSIPNVRWALPSTGKPAASFAEYLAAVGRNPASLQVSGSDWIELWSNDGGTVIHGRLI